MTERTIRTESAAETPASRELAPPLAGAIAGVIATGPMTLAMLEIQRRLPPEERSPLPPATLTRETILPDRAPGPAGVQAAVATAAHFAIGAGGGALYAATAGRIRSLPLAFRGLAYGAGFWAANYVLAAPLTGVRANAFRMPPRRNAMMFAAHLVWGVALAYAEDVVRRHGNPFLVGSRKAPRAE